MMDSQLFRCHQYFSNPVISIVLLSLIIPIHNAQNNSEMYKVCSEMTTSACGKPVSGLEYPFWGKNIRPEYCGQKGFELSCENRDLVVDIGTDSKHRVVEINPSKSLLTLKRYGDPVEELCASSWDSSTILNKTLYEYGQNTADLYVFYRCDTQEDARLILSKTSCSFPYPYEQLQLISCAYNTTVPVDKTMLEQFYMNDSMPLREILEYSFEIHYKINNSACADCRESGGVCWNNTDLEVSSKCLYKTGGNNKNHTKEAAPSGAKSKNHTKEVAPSGKNKNSGLKFGIASGVVGGSILLLLVLIIYYRQMKSKHDSSLFPQNVSSYPKDFQTFIRQHGSSIPKRFRYSTVKKITNSFRDELGRGGYGNVYRGRLVDGRDVAVKVLNATKGNGEEFINEVVSIGRTSHVNVVTLLGFCYEGKRRALIYEFMPNGSLEKFIYGTTPLLEGKHLGWERLYRIAIGIARGLEYLHQGCNTRILHFDIKPHNILLDEDFSPKISDFGLAKLYTRKESAVSCLLQARGTIGYIAPEVISRNFGQVSHKSDVYSYGMMILEMVGGRKNINAGADHTSEIYYPRWLYKRIKFDDVLNLATEISKEENELARKMVIVGLWCIQIYPSQRPSIDKVIDMLEGNIAALEIPPNPYLCSVPSSPSGSDQTKQVFCFPSGTASTSSP